MERVVPTLGACSVSFYAHTGRLRQQLACVRTVRSGLDSAQRRPPPVRGGSLPSSGRTIEDGTRRPFAAYNLAVSASGDLTGSTIRSYRITGRIGAGGMGEVYLAHDEKLGRNVAIKFLPPHLALDRDRLERFRREAQAASALNHPNVLVVHELDESDGRAFIVTEYIEGQTLRERLSSGPLP